MSDSDSCPCGSGLQFENCCEPYLLERKAEPTAEALMRARYTAYALCAIDYLYKTSGPKIRRQFDAEGSKKWSESSEWTGIDIIAKEGGGEDDETGTVEFVAHYSAKKLDFNHHEVAQFRRIDGKWRFIDGKIIGPDPLRRDEPKVGRNDPCPCGSGKKYKKCCGKGM